MRSVVCKSVLTAREEVRGAKLRYGKPALERAVPNQLIHYKHCYGTNGTKFRCMCGEAVKSRLSGVGWRRRKVA